MKTNCTGKMADSHKAAVIKAGAMIKVAILVVL